MRLFVTLPFHSPSDPLDQEYIGQVTRIEDLPDGNRGIAVQLLSAAGIKPVITVLGRKLLIPPSSFFVLSKLDICVPVPQGRDTALIRPIRFAVSIALLDALNILNGWYSPTFALQEE